MSSLHSSLLSPPDVSLLCQFGGFLEVNPLPALEGGRWGGLRPSRPPARPGKVRRKWAEGARPPLTHSLGGWGAAGPGARGGEGDAGLQGDEAPGPSPRTPRRDSDPPAGNGKITPQLEGTKAGRAPSPRAPAAGRAPTPAEASAAGPAGPAHVTSPTRPHLRYSATWPGLGAPVRGRSLGNHPFAVDKWGN